MSEEKKAIDYLKNDVVYWLDKGKDFVVIDIGENEKLHTILNLIEKQEKEIEKLKFDNHMVGKWNEYLDKYCISKDKIREKIKELDKEYKEIQERQIEMSTFMKIAEQHKNKKDILQELLEEK